AKADAILSISELRDYLKQELPEYMLPSAYVMLDALPLTENGKLDRRALPSPTGASVELEKRFAAPRTKTEQKLTELWAELLGVDRVGINDDFFELGGHSLLAAQVVTRLRTAFQIELPMRRLFEEPTIAGLAQIIEALLQEKTVAGVQSIKKVSRDEPIPLSYAQQRLWFLNQLDPGSSAYNLPSALRLAGRLDTVALQRTLNEVVRRHESLCTTFAEVNGEPRQIISQPERQALEVIDLRALPDTEREAEAARLVREEALCPFDLSRGPLLRARLLRLDEEHHVLLFTMHHIVSDGWSMGVLVREVGTLYSAYSQGIEPLLPELSVQYADYAVWQHAWL